MDNSDKAKLYREYARELLSWAEQTYSNEERRILVIAAKYHRLAKYFEDDVAR